MRHLLPLTLAVLTITETAFGQTTATPRPRVSDLRVSRLDDPAHRAASQFPSGTPGVECTFDVQGLPRGSTVTLTWFRDGTELMTSRFGAVEGSSTLSARLESDETLEPGAYRAELSIDDVPEGRTAFVIDRPVDDGQRDRATPQPRVSNVILTTDAECSASSPSVGDFLFSGFVESVSLCLSYDDMPSSRTLEVRWYNDATPRRPMTASSFAPNGSGDLTVSYLSDGPMTPGSYHVEVALGSVVLQRTRFAVEP